VVKTQGKAELWLLGQTFYYIEGKLQITNELLPFLNRGLLGILSAVFFWCSLNLM
jgi:hypothetical protein